MKYCASFFFGLALLAGSATAQEAGNPAKEATVQPSTSSADSNTPSSEAKANTQAEPAKTEKPTKKTAKKSSPKNIKKISSPKKRSTEENEVADGEAPAKKKAAAAMSDDRTRSATAVVKEGGKTCSGLDEYRICW